MPAATLAAGTVTAHAGADSPWRIQDQIDNEHLLLRGQSLLRFESLDGQYRQSRGDSEQMLIIRNRLLAGIRFDNWSIVTEFMDTRQRLADERSPISDGMINTLEFVQTYIQFTPSNVFTDGDQLSIKLGKQVMNLGARRLIASTYFRGSDNAFAGVRADWRPTNNTELNAIYFHPVRRLPNNRTSLLNNTRETDDILENTRFYGASLNTSGWAQDLHVEMTVLQLTEDDTPALATFDRDITTLGGRLWYQPKTSPLSVDLDAYYQWGNSSLTTTGGELLDHRAWQTHLDVSWRLNTVMSPQLSLLYDFASGDRNPNDKENNRFSTLYGVQPFDYGWTGIYGAFIRENIDTPGIRLRLKPHQRVNLEFTLRKMRLASARDRWRKAGLSDPSGASGSNLGSQLNVKAVWNVVPGNVKLVAGYSNLFAGTYQEQITGKRFDTHYGFLQAVVDF